jgi:uncharacterized protein YdeI (YjbR/CyaY-like superfamily)
MATRRPANSVEPRSADEWRDWLAEHHTRAEGVWLVIWKKATGRQAMDYDTQVEEALAWGWVDSKTNLLDENRSMLWFAPRKPGTGWSRPNKQRIERLIATGRLQPAGRAKVEAAQADGSWSKLDAVEDLIMPPDLTMALAARPDAARHFDAFPRSAKRGILEWIAQARRPETRAARIAETARLAQDNQRANQWKRAA